MFLASPLLSFNHTHPLFLHMCIDRLITLPVMCGQTIFCMTRFSFVSRAFVEFERPVGSRLNPLTPTPTVLEAVYLALYMRHRRQRLVMQLMDDRSLPQKAISSSPKEELSPETPSPLPPLKLPTSGVYQVLVTSVSCYCWYECYLELYNVVVVVVVVFVVFCFLLLLKKQQLIL